MSATQSEAAASRFFDADVMAEPFEVWSELREEAPVCPVSRDTLAHTEFTVVARYSDVMQALRDPDTFSNQISLKFEGGVSPYEDADAVKEIMKDACPYVDVLAFSDGAVHSRHRKMVLRGFSARRTKLLETVVQELADEMFDSLPFGEPIEFWHEVCTPLPINVMANILGVRREDAPRMKTWADAQVSRLNGQASESEEKAIRIAHTMVDFHTYIATQIKARQETPHDDFLGDMVANSEGMTVVELVHVGSHLLIGGAETTASLIASLLDLLVDDPQRWAALKADRSLIPDVIEEVLRTQAPIKLVYRITTKDTELGGQKIEKNTVVLLMLGSANRDPGAFVAPEDFDVDRTGDRRHIAFGYGAHLCPGAALARAEARIILETMFDRGIEIRRDHEVEPKHLPNLTFREFSELPLILSQQS